ncbi:MAG: DUF4347 domain-containing protein, partial [Spirulina sp.]
LNAKNLTRYASLLQQWRSRLNCPHLEILLYGCQVAKGARGREFVEQFGRFTGAKIAASTTLTGNAALKGNWQLEYKTGQISSPLAFQPEILPRYPSIFADFNINAGDIAGLIAAINTANSNTEADTINLTQSTFSLTTTDNNSNAFGATGLPIITSEITINGNNSIVERSSSASDLFRLFVVDSSTSAATLTLNNVTLQNGRVDNTSQSLGDDGGALLNHGGTVTINGSTITNNSAADDGGALVNVGIGSSAATMTINGTTLSNNIANGDGGNNDGGGAIENDGNQNDGGLGATLTISNSTITGNTHSTGSGGAIRVKDGGTLTITDTSMTSNSGSVGGGGISTYGTPNGINITLTNTTVTGNTGGNNVENLTGTATATNGGGNSIGSSNIPEFQANFSVTRTDTGATILPDDNVNLGTLIVGVDPVVTTTFSITNSGGTDLNITNLPSLSGSSFFTIDTSSLTTPIASGNSTTFDVTFDPSTVGSYQTTVSFTTDNNSLTNFSFTMSATVSDPTPTPSPTPPPTPSDFLSVDSGTNVFTTGSVGGSNLKVSLQGAAISTLSTIKLLRLDGNNQTTSTFELFSALPDSFRPSGFGIDLQGHISGTFASGDRFSLELQDMNGSTTSFSPGNLSVSDRGSGVFDLSFGNGLTLQIQQTTASTPLGVGTNQGVGLEVIDLLSTAGSVQANFSAYREANFDNVVGLYKIDDINGTVGGLAPGDAGYAKAAIENRVTNISLSPANQTQTSLSIALDGSSLYAPFIIVKSTPTAFLNDNPNNAVSANSNAYFLYSAANPDSFDHLVLLGNNTFGFEDLFNGGDRDYNDIIFTVDLTV